MTRFVSYKFLDSKGNLRDKVIASGRELKDTCFDGSSFGFKPTNNSDLLLVPDTESEHYDPIRKMDGVFCFIREPNKEWMSEDFRTSAYVAMNYNEQTAGDDRAKNKGYILHYASN